MEPIGYNKDKACNVLHKYNINVLIASTPVNVFYTTGLPTLHVAPNPILYVLSKQFPSISLIKENGELSLITWITYNSINKFSWVNDVSGIASPKAAMVEICDRIEKWGLSEKTIAYESLMPTYQYEYLQEKFPNATFIRGDQAFLDMRLTKSEEEIRRILILDRVNIR